MCQPTDVHMHFCRTVKHYTKKSPDTTIHAITSCIVIYDVLNDLKKQKCTAECAVLVICTEFRNKQWRKHTVIQWFLFEGRTNWINKTWEEICKKRTLGTSLLSSFQFIPQEPFELLCSEPRLPQGFLYHFLPAFIKDCFICCF